MDLSLLLGTTHRFEVEKEKDIITCNNSACNKYRTPVGTIRKSSKPLDEIKMKSKSKSKKSVANTVNFESEKP